MKRRERERESTHMGDRPPPPPPPWPFGSSFYMFFPPLGLPYVNWPSQKCCLFYLRSSLWSLGLPLFYFRRVFPSLSFSHCHSGLLFPTRCLPGLVPQAQPPPLCSVLRTRKQREAKGKGGVRTEHLPSMSSSALPSPPSPPATPACRLVPTPAPQFLPLP